MSSQTENETILKTAEALYASYKNVKKDPKWNEKNNNDKMAYFQNSDFNDFIIKYAIVARYMIMYDEFSSKAFSQYLTRLKAIGYKSKDEWCERQADYVKYLWHAYNVHGNNKEAKLVWMEAKEKIKGEMDSFENDYKKAKDKSDIKQKEFLSDRKQLLKELLLSENKTTVENIDKKDDSSVFD